MNLKANIEVNLWRWLIIVVFLLSFVWFLSSVKADDLIADSFHLPLEGEWNPSRGFAKEFISSWCGFHLGDDLPRDPDTPVFPVAKGKVKFANLVVGYTVMIEHLLTDNSRVTSVYYHLKRPEDGGIALVEDSEVNPETPLGFVSGREEDHRSAPHLHFGIRKGPFNFEKDSRTEKWFYPGYTTIYQDGIRQCNEFDPVHAEITSEWADPIEFIINPEPSAGIINLPQTGQMTCYDSSGNVIDCTCTGQDGDIQAGVAWPTTGNSPSGRFNDNNDGTVTDLLTGLMWLKDGACFGTRTWQGALDVVADFKNNPTGYNCQDLIIQYPDWRLPNVNELASFMNAEKPLSSWLNQQGFVNVQTHPYYHYYTSTTFTAYKGSAYVVDMADAHVGSHTKNYNHYVWPVRAGQTHNPDLRYPANIPKTSQTKCYDSAGTEILCAGTGQDGEIQAGVTWPDPRFTDKGDGTLKDNLTGLIWLKDANCFERGITWKQAFDTIIDLNTNPSNYNCQEYSASYSDWRLPNNIEGYSLTDFSQYSPALPFGNPFVNVQLNPRSWTSSSNFIYKYAAYIIGLGSGGTHSYAKTASSDIWPVRGGLTENDPCLTTSTWEKTFGGAGYDIGSSVQQTSDGGYIITGETDGNVYLIKTDSSGNKTWEKTFGGASYDIGWSVQQTSDGGYIIAGSTFSYGAGAGDVYLIKTDSSGNLTWEKIFGGADDDDGASVQQTSDGGYIIVGGTSSYGAS